MATRATASQPFRQEGYALMAAAFEVHNELGGGLLEEIYQEALAIELGLRSIPFASKPRIQAFYKTARLQKRYVPDFTVYEKIVVELKAVSGLLREHEAQLVNYLRLTRCPVGYLLNFAPPERLQWKRFVFSEFLDSESTQRNS